MLFTTAALQELTLLKDSNQKLKVLLAVGGETQDNTEFTDMVKTSASRSEFIDHAVSFLRLASLTYVMYSYLFEFSFVKYTVYYVYKHTHAHTQTQTHTHTNANTQTRMHIHLTHTLTHTCTHTHIRTRAHTHTHSIYSLVSTTITNAILWLIPTEPTT